MRYANNGANLSDDMSRRFHPPLVSEALPALFDRLNAGIQRLHGPLPADLVAHLATQLPRLKMTSRCGCKDAFCGSFTTTGGSALPDGARGRWTLDIEPGALHLDIDGGKIVFVELIDSSEDVRRVNETFDRMRRGA
jgi:hypothetical protein